MHAAVNLGQLMAFVLIDDKKIARSDAVKAVVDQKLLSAKDGVVELVAVMDVHVHGFFFFVQMGDGKGTRLLTVFNGGFAGGKLLHRMSFLCAQMVHLDFLSFSIASLFKICNIYTKI